MARSPPPAGTSRAALVDAFGRFWRVLRSFHPLDCCAAGSNDEAATASARQIVQRSDWPMEGRREHPGCAEGRRRRLPRNHAPLARLLAPHADAAEMENLLLAVETRMAEHHADQDDEAVERPVIGFANVEIPVV